MSPICKPVPGSGDRKLFCTHYNACLDHAIQKQWEDWDCSGCQNRLREDAPMEIRATVNHAVAYYDLHVET
jgi:hypothetical protein